MPITEAQNIPSLAAGIGINYQWYQLSRIPAIMQRI